MLRSPTDVRNDLAFGVLKVTFRILFFCKLLVGSEHDPFRSDQGIFPVTLSGGMSIAIPSKGV